MVSGFWFDPWELCTSPQDPIHVWSGGLDNILKSFDINSSTESAHGSHEGAIKCVEFSGETIVATTTWWSTVHVPRHM